MSALATQQNRLAEVTRLIAEYRRQGAALVYRIGLALREVQDEELWRAGGFASFSAWVESEAAVSRSTAARAIEVTRHFSEDMASRYGLEKLYWGLRYVALTGVVEQPGDLVAAELRIRGSNGRFQSVGFHEATTQQVQDAVQLALKGQRRALSAGTDADLGARLDRLRDALPATPRGLSPARDRVELARTRGGEVALTFRQIPLSELRAFLEAVEREML